jgi:hypothetical protein
MDTFLQKSIWIPLTLLVAVVGLVLLGVQISTPGNNATNMYARLDSPNHTTATQTSNSDHIGSINDAHVPSVRNILDPDAPGYIEPTDPQWGIVGSFPGDTTIIVEQGQHLVAARLTGQPGDTLRVQWGNHKYPIVAVYGGGLGWKQRYITVFGDYHFMLPIQWDEHSSNWEPYGVERWITAAGPDVPREEDSLEGRCSDCHTATDVDQSGLAVVGAK